jgi:hypothetical protein
MASHSPSIPCIPNAKHHAVRHGHLAVVQQYYAMLDPAESAPSFMDLAASSGQLRILQWFHHHTALTCPSWILHETITWMWFGFCTYIEQKAVRWTRWTVRLGRAF